jgi:pyridoxamine 5'-phosphate oxidase
MSTHTPILNMAELREEYMREKLDEHDVAADPITQFRAWFDEAVQAQIPMVNAMTLATATASGEPAARIVLLKGVDEGGFVFYTSYESRKGHELARNPQAALLFYWIELEREVRIEGRVEKTTTRESDDYFVTRPLGSRLAAIASAQSAVVPDRAYLEARFSEAERDHPEGPARPAHWGGYRVLPATIEFWQGRPNRLHDRLLYRRASSGGWTIQRLAP